MSLQVEGVVEWHGVMSHYVGAVRLKRSIANAPHSGAVLSLSLSLDEGDLLLLEEEDPPLLKEEISCRTAHDM